ncbi:MAG: four helix bundle protein [Flavisolibacter sp.]
MATITTFEDLEIWQAARKFAGDIFETYTNSESFFKDHGLKEQVYRSSGSIMDSIAQGFERNSRDEFTRFLSIGRLSVGEAKSQLQCAFDRNYIAKELFDKLYLQADELGKIIGGLINYLKKSEFGEIEFLREDAPDSKS